MASVDFPEPIRDLISHLKQLPGVGPKSAERIAVWLIQHGGEVSGALAESLAEAGQSVGECDVCGFFRAKTEGCRICDLSGRKLEQLCIVEQPTDIIPLERSGAYRGHYHVLRGKLSPLDDVGPEDLRIAELRERLLAGTVNEVILALGADVEGEATANYLSSILGDSEGLKVTRLAHGLPVGSGLDSAGELTLLRALEGRREL